MTNEITRRDTGRTDRPDFENNRPPVPCRCPRCSKSRRLDNTNHRIMGNWNIEQVKRALKQAVRDFSWFAKNCLVPALEETLNFISTVLVTIWKAFETKDHSLKSEFTNGDEVLSTSNTGFVIDGRRKIPGDTNLHLLVSGESGSGKSTICVMNSIHEAQDSAVVLDVSGELLATSGYLKTKGKTIKVLHFGNASISEGYNPLARIKSVSDIQKIVSLLVRTVLKSSNDPFWNLATVSLLTTLIRALQFEPIEKRHFGNVRHLLHLLSGANPAIVDALIARSADMQLVNEYKSFLAMDIKLKTNIISTALASTNIFADPQVAKITSTDTIDFEAFRSVPTVLYLQCPVADNRFYADLFSIFFEQMAASVMERLPKPSDLRITFILDEFPVMYIPNIQTIASTIRKHKSNLMVICQDISQIYDIYGKEQGTALIANCHSKLYFSVSHSTAIQLSSVLGKYEYIDKDSNTKRIRNLLEPFEIRTLNKAIFIHGHAQPILLDTTPIYKHPFWKLRLKLPQPLFTSPLPIGEVPLTN